jgi:hypothetical protein
MGSFEDWDRVVRGATWFATGRDPLTTQRRAEEVAPDRRKQLTLLEGWHGLPDGGDGGRGVTASEAMLPTTSIPSCRRPWSSMESWLRGTPPCRSAESSEP